MPFRQQIDPTRVPTPVGRDRRWRRRWDHEVAEQLGAFAAAVLVLGLVVYAVTRLVQGMGPQH